MLITKVATEKERCIPWLSDNYVSSGLTVRKTKVSSYKVGAKTSKLSRFFNVLLNLKWMKIIITHQMWTEQAWVLMGLLCQRYQLHSALSEIVSLVV